MSRPLLILMALAVTCVSRENAYLGPRLDILLQPPGCIALYASTGPRDTRQVDVRPGPAVGLARQDGLRWAREDWPFEWKVLGEGDGYPPALMGDEKGAAPQLSLAEAGKVSVVATQSLLLARLGTTCYSSRGGEQGNAQILARPGSATEEEWCRHSWQTSRQTFRMRM